MHNNKLISLQVRVGVAAKFCDTVVLLRQGKIGTSSTCFRAPAFRDNFRRRLRSVSVRIIQFLGIVFRRISVPTSLLFVDTIQARA